MAAISPRVIDLSHHNFDDRPGNVNWDAVKRDGIWGVIFKATEDTDYVDPYYDEIRRQVTAAGLLWGAYHFFRPGNVSSQVDNFLRHATPGPSTLLCLDHEDDGCSLDDVKDFLRLVEQRTSQRPVLYSGYVLKEQIGDRHDQYLAGTRLWLAQYGSDPEAPANWPGGAWLWQYTDGDAGPTPHTVNSIGACDINSYDGTHDQLTQTWAEASIAPPSPPDPPTPSPDQAPAWLQAMRAITGMTEAPGSADNPRILHMAQVIGDTYPAQKAYADSYRHDDTPWCGLTVAYCMTIAGIEPVFGPTDTDRWMWAQAWADWDDSTELSEPQLGCVVVMTREGGGHVTLFEHWDGNKLVCRGGNQGDEVKLSEYDPSTVIAYCMPRRALPVQIQGLEPHELQLIQAALNVVSVDPPLLDVDGEYGPKTEEAIKDFQQVSSLAVNGIPTKGTVAELLRDCEAWNHKRKLIEPSG